MSPQQHHDDFFDPEFPTAIGEDSAVIFNKDGREYRLMKIADAQWIIHQRDVEPKDFELVVHGDGPSIDVIGKGHFGPLTALGATRGLLFSKLF